MEKGSIVKRNAGLDILKLLCAFLVICIHIQFAGKEWIEPLTRAAVPVFFMITGWFYSDDRAGQKKQILKILWIFILSSGLYLFLGFIKTAIYELPVREFLASVFSLNAAKLFLLFNHVGVEVHLWYLPALLYVLVIAAFLGKRGRRMLCWAVPLFLAAAVILGAYSPLLLGRKLPNFVGRNFLFTGLPCFLLGEHLHAVRHKLCIRPTVLFILTCLSVVLTLCERRFVQNCTGYEGADLYVGSIFMAVFMLLLATSTAPSPGGRLGRILAVWGRKYSLGVYVLHMAVAWLVQLLFGGLFSRSYPAAKIYYYTAPLVLLVFSTAITALLKAVKKRLLPR